MIKSTFLLLLAEVHTVKISESWMPTLLFLLVSIVLLGVVWRIMKRCAGQQAYHQEYLERARNHMEADEAKTERIVQLLESIDRKLGERNS